MNLRPSGYEPDELPGCSTPRQGMFVREIRGMGPEVLGCECGLVDIRFRSVSAWAGLDWLGLLSRFGDDLLSHVLRRSTIGATALNCRVRDGIGCFPAAMITKPGKRARFSSGFQVKSLTEVLGMYGFRSWKSCFHWIGSSLSDH